MTEQHPEQHPTTGQDLPLALAAWAGRVAGAAALDPVAREALATATAAELEGGQDLPGAAASAARDHAAEQLQHLKELISIGAIPGPDGDRLYEAVTGILDSPPFATEPADD